MKMTEEYILSILSGEETLENTKLLNIRYVVEPELKDGLTINDISNEYDYDTIWCYDYIFQIIGNIADEIGFSNEYYLSESRKDNLIGIKLKDIHTNNVIAISRIEDEYFENEKIEGVKVNWKLKKIYINDYELDHFNFEELFDYFNGILADGIFKEYEMWWD